MNEIKAALKITYDGIEIEYLEDKNVWRFELRGRERRANSLLEAKTAIDRPVKEKPAKEFERFEAHLTHGYMDHRQRQVVTVTSVADANHVWISSEDKNRLSGRIEIDRSKKHITDLWAITPENRKLWEEFDAIGKTIKHLESKRAAILKRIKNIDVSAWLKPEADL